jgi:rod shape determining protein RodA
VKHWKNFDWQLLALPTILVTFSVIMLYAISRWSSSVPANTPVKQALYFCIGVVVFWILTNLDYRLLRSLIPPGYILSLLLLIAVLIIGRHTNGAVRWINLGFLQLQPSEPAKLAVILMLGRFLADRESHIDRFSTFIWSLVIVGVPTLLVLRQPDFGSAMVFGAIWAAMMVTASVPVIYLVTAAAGGALAAPFAWHLLKPFQRSRLTTFLHPQQDPLGAGWDIIHARIAVGSGGLFGQWFSQGTQSRLDFLHVQDKDFIFSVIAEQIGFVGIMVLFVAYGLLFMRIARVAFMAADTFGRLITSGILAMLLFQTFVNIGMNIGIMPVTGIPLPLISYGGSSLITSFAAFGILESILLRHQKLVFAPGG